MNPYDFVRMDWQQGVEHHQATPHGRFAKDSLSGRIEGIITTLTPFFIPHSEDLRRKDTLYNSRPPEPITFARNKAEQYIIPGSSLKGLFRSVVETVGPGCWWLYGQRYQLPRDFRQCPHKDGLCIACRLFGLVNKDILRLGQVNFDDAICKSPVPYDPIYTPILSAPKPRHRAWYTDDSEHAVGRKFYFHQSTDKIQVEQGFRPKQGTRQNQYIQPIGMGNIFTFSIHFSNIESADWPALLYALTLERKAWAHPHDVRHKLGYAKPAGLGSVEVQLTKLMLIDYQERYRRPDKGIVVHEGEDLRDYVNQRIKQRFLEADNNTLRDLRRIWGWPPDTTVTYHYPDWNWFKANPTTPIDQTP